MISIIIPIYNEEKIISENSLQFLNLSRKANLIFVDGGSSDKTIDIAAAYGIVLNSKKGRSIQMNCGARSAKDDILLFLHADTFISVDTILSIERRLKDGDYIGGCLTQEIAKDGIIFRIIENFGNIRARITNIFYGDQGIFVKKNVFFKIGGFPEVPIMEDVLFSKRLQRYGKTIVLPNKITVSPRRWEKKGILKTIFFYTALNILFWLKVPLNKIKLLYDDLR